MVTFLRGQKLKEKYFDAYRVVAVKTKDSYDVEKVRVYEGPSITSECNRISKIMVSMSSN